MDSKHSGAQSHHLQRLFAMEEDWEGKEWEGEEDAGADADHAEPPAKKRLKARRDPEPALQLATNKFVGGVNADHMAYILESLGCS